MAAPDGAGSGPNLSLFASLRSFWSVLVAILYTRLDLVTAELEDEAKRGIKILVAGLIGLQCLFIAFIFAMLFIVACWWDTPYRSLVIGIFLGVYLLGGVISFFAVYNMVVNRPRFLSQTLTELRRDVEGLKTAVTTHRDEPKP